jgi:hypothetical protein
LKGIWANRCFPIASHSCWVSVTAARRDDVLLFVVEVSLGCRVELVESCRGVQTVQPCPPCADLQEDHHGPVVAGQHPGPDCGPRAVQPGILELPHTLDGTVLRRPQGAVDQMPDGVGPDAHPSAVCAVLTPASLSERASTRRARCRARRASPKSECRRSALLPVLPDTPFPGLLGHLRDIGQDRVRSDIGYPRTA